MRFITLGQFELIEPTKMSHAAPNRGIGNKLGETTNWL